MGCNNFQTEKMDALVEASMRGENSGIESCPPEVREAIERVMPGVEREIEEFNRETTKTIREIEADFKEIIEKNFEIERESPKEHVEEPWKPDDFEKEGFGPIIRPLPEPDGLLGDIKVEKIDEVKIERRGRVLAETDLGSKKGPIWEYEVRTEEEIKEKESHLQEALRSDFKDKPTPEEKAIIKESKAGKDAEKMQREWIKEGAHIHDMGHHIKDRLFTPAKETKLEKYYQECKERDKFVSDYARRDRHEFYCENLRVFCTQGGDSKVKEYHPEMYHLIENDVKFLESWKMVEEYKEK